MGQIFPSSNAKLPASPSRRVRDTFGARRLAEICGRTTEAVRKWDRPKSKGGTGGLVPAEFQARILAAAVAEGLPLEAADLIAEPVA